MDKSENSPTCILIADDDADVLKALRLLLKGEGFESVMANSGAAILAALRERDFGALLMDLNYTRGSTSGREGLDLLSRIREQDSALPIVVMTAWGSIELAVEAMRHGARDFVTKPWQNERLMTTLRTQIELGRALRRGDRLEQENQFLRGDSARPCLIAESKAMQPVLEMIVRTGPSDANVLITGENGTGKSVVAQALHAASARAARPIVTVNIGGLSETIFESELFGHVRGAFTDAKSDRMGRFEIADKGTLFLDEIANIPPSAQSKLLRVLENGEFEPVGSSKTRRADVRIISATNADLEREVAEGRFRQDLLYRLNTIHIHLPPLRERREDIPLLAELSRRNHSEHYRKKVGGFDSAAMRVMLEYSWPGNVRELDHAVERAMLMARDGVIRVGDLGLSMPQAGMSSQDGAMPGGTKSLEDASLEEVERLLIQKAIARHEGNVAQAAKALGLSRSALYRRLERHGL